MSQSSLHTEPQPREKFGTRHKVFSIIALLFVVVWAVVALRAITFAQGDAPEPVDAVYVLGPVSEHRLATGIELVESGYSTQLVVTHSGHDPIGNPCNSDSGVAMHCLTPEPMNTAGEAEGFAQLATEYDWTSVMVVTTGTHLSRAGYYFEQCVDGNVVMIDEGTEIAGQPHVYRFVYENAAFVKAWLSSTCR